MGKSTRKDSDLTPPSTPPGSDYKPPAMVKAEAMQVRCFELAEAVLQRIERRVTGDRDYKPSPSDLIGIFQATAAVQALVYDIPALQARMAAFKTEVEALEAKLLGLLTSDPPKKDAPPEKLV